MSRCSKYLSCSLVPSGEGPAAAPETPDSDAPTAAAAAGAAADEESGGWDRRAWSWLVGVAEGEGREVWEEGEDGVAWTVALDK